MTFASYGRSSGVIVLLVLLAAGCSAASNTATGDGGTAGTAGTAGDGGQKPAATPCTGSVTGAATGGFTSCGFDAEPFARKSASADSSAFLFVPTGLSPSFNAITVDFELVGTPMQRSYRVADMVSVEITVQNTDNSDPFVLRRANPPSPQDQGDVTLTFTSVRYDAVAQSYFVHGSFDATLPSQKIGNPGAAPTQSTLHVDF